MNQSEGRPNKCALPAKALQRQRFTEPDASWTPKGDWAYGYTVKLVRTSIGNAGHMRKHSNYDTAHLTPAGYEELIHWKSVILPAMPDMEVNKFEDSGNFESDFTATEHFEEVRMVLAENTLADISQKTVDRRQYSYSLIIEFYAGFRKWNGTDFIGHMDVGTEKTLRETAPGLGDTQTEMVFIPIPNSNDYATPGKIKFRGAIVKYLQSIL